MLILSYICMSFVLFIDEVQNVSCFVMLCSFSYILTSFSSLLLEYTNPCIVDLHDWIEFCSCSDHV